jgi:hypothetical protein
MIMNLQITTEFIEEVRELAEVWATVADDELDFFCAAMYLGASENQADNIARQLIELDGLPVTASFRILGDDHIQ